MTKKEMNQIMEAINGIKAEVSELRSEVDALKGVSVKKSTTSSSKRTTTTSSKKKTATTSKVEDFEPKKDSDGNYNYKSWKTCRRNFVAKKSGKDLTKEWMDYAEFCKLAAPFDKKYPYVKKSDR